MPPTKSGPSGGGSFAAKEWRMPRPPAVVLWRNAPGGDVAYAVVTKYNRNSVAVMVFPPESRVGVPKDGVRFVEDPWNKTNGINADSGVWDYTDDYKVFQFVVAQLVEKGLIDQDPSNSHLFARLAK